MDLTPENKARIDSMSYMELLHDLRFVPAGGSPWFQGETGKYWLERMTFLRSQPNGQEEHVRCSKALGWER